VLYILDEPSIGLHQRDNQKLLRTLKGLRDIGNTVIVVEHDEETMREADFIVDLGPGAGLDGGHVVATGTVDEIQASKKSLTGKYLSGNFRFRCRPCGGGERLIRLKGARENNLRDLR
jgi:excinuclease ABC subunit A